MTSPHTASGLARRPDKAPLQIACPSCKAAIGQICVNSSTVGDYVCMERALMSDRKQARLNGDIEGRPDNGPLNVPCPWRDCGAGPGQACRSLEEGVGLAEHAFHKPRAEAFDRVAYASRPRDETPIVVRRPYGGPMNVACPTCKVPRGERCFGAAYDEFCATRAALSEGSGRPLRDGEGGVAPHPAVVMAAQAVSRERARAPIIGITGRAGSGKDTIADILVNEHRFTKIAFADPLKRICRDVFQFSDTQLWGPSSARNAPDQRYPRSLPCHSWRRGLDGKYTCDGCLQVVQPYDTPPAPCEGFLTPRHALQQLGTEWGRACYGNVWVDYAMRTATRLLADDRDDPRGVNYYSAQSGLLFVGGLKKPAGVVISDVRFPNEVEALRAAGARVWKATHAGTADLSGAAAAHASESYIDGLKADIELPDCDLDALPHVVRNILRSV